MKPVPEGVIIEVLLVEDSPGDIRLTQEAFRETNSSVQLHIAADGLESNRVQIVIGQ